MCHDGTSVHERAMIKVSRLGFRVSKSCRFAKLCISRSTQILAWAQLCEFCVGRARMRYPGLRYDSENCSCGDLGRYISSNIHSGKERLPWLAGPLFTDTAWLMLQDSRWWYIENATRDRTRSFSTRCQLKCMRGATIFIWFFGLVEK